MAPEGQSAESGRIEPVAAAAQEWVLLDGRRVVVAGLVVAALFLAFTALSLSGLSPFDDAQPLFYVFGSLVSGNLTIITVVVSINQLLLSRELHTPHQLRSQIDGVIDYRKEVEDSAGQVAPVEPLGFLRLVYENTRREAQRLGGLSITEADDDTTEEVDAVVEDVTDHADRVDSLLRDGNPSTFHVLSTTLTTNHARDINRLRRIKWRHGDDLPDHVADGIDDLIDQLQNIDVARQYFKSIYLQNELATLSRYLFYTGLPSIATVVGALFLFTAGSGNGSVVPASALPLLAAATVTVGLAPLAVLCSFILRTATVTQRTAATLPFTAPSQEK
ncbi:hypothetical protein ACFQMA_14640 [Halosimplex aquaticum]|uniref:Uncharacterized protein n=1 Tax=Halosimplex aquaticum TaxID=3026162 RepID=A0ABD5Y159_9EURY|nr:hypothetical protein [Halosimplex aquaticum]